MTSSDFEKLIIQQKDKLFRFAMSILRNTDDAQDAVQEVVLRIWQNKRSLDNSRNLESYCLNTLKNYCLDCLRKEKYKSEFQNSWQRNDVFSKQEFENIDLVKKLQEELKLLPTHQRMAVELKDFQGYEYEEISEILNQNINSVRANVSRGRKKLHEIFKEELKNE